MAVWTVKTQRELAGAMVLAPERYDPRRHSLTSESLNGGTVPLGHLVVAARKTITPSSGIGSCLVLDTSDAKEGLVMTQKEALDCSLLGSAKKMAEVGDVIISRLRPYLRQVAFLDPGIQGTSPGMTILCSTEFFVLRPRDAQAISFLVPFLLSEPVQRVLAASQEGGHHPRFDEQTLLGLPVPLALIHDRDKTSRAVEEGASLYRRCEAAMVRLVGEAGAQLEAA